MIYLSKGIVQKGSTEQLLFVLYGGQKFELTGNAAAAWLNGRFKFAEALDLHGADKGDNLRKLSGAMRPQPLICKSWGLWKRKRTMMGFLVIGSHPGAYSVRQTLPDHLCSELWIKKYCSG